MTVTKFGKIDYFQLFEKNMKCLSQASEGLLKQDEVPEEFREVGIITGYRYPNSSYIECILSIFKATNETLNFWTHFLPGVLMFRQILELWSDEACLTDVYVHPMLIYLVFSTLYLLTSAFIHLFSCHSEEAFYICFFTDYVTLALYSLGTSFAYRSYAFSPGYLQSTFADWYLVVATINAVLSVSWSSQTLFRENGVLTTALRVGSFAWPYIFTHIPMVYRLIYDSLDEDSINGAFCHKLQIVWLIISASAYISHVPEIWFPGYFDIIGNSHHILHVCGSLATWSQMTGLVLDMKLRRDKLEEHNTIPYRITSLLLCAMAIYLSIHIIKYYIHKSEDKISMLKQQRSNMDRQRKDQIDKNGAKNEILYQNGVINDATYQNGILNSDIPELKSGIATQPLVTETQVNKKDL